MCSISYNLIPPTLKTCDLVPLLASAAAMVTLTPLRRYSKPFHECLKPPFKENKQMAQVINTNIMSLNAQRNLNTTTSSLASSVQRLSSGLRINSAKDDAAGLAISERFTTQIRGLEVAARNANDGISLAQTAEGALAEIGNNLQRIRELAVQSRNATNSDSDRAALNAEVEQLKSEIQRVADHTEFNGTKLLNGSFQNAVFQIGANQGQKIDVAKIANANIAALGEWTSPTVDKYDIADAGTITVTDGSKGASLSINGVSFGIDAVKTGETRDADKAKAALIAAFEEAKKSHSELKNVTIGTDGKISSTDAELTIGSINNLTASKTTTDADGNATTTAGLAEGTVKGVKTTVTGTAQTGFESETVLTAEAADKMILAMDAALNSVNSNRAELGAIQNRFTSVVANLNSTSENLSASRSRIRDTDYARETSELTRTQILQQAGTAMLAQAKSMPQSVLSLLQ